MQTIEIFGIPFLKKGYKIHIKKKNRGKFTKSAEAAGQTVQEHATSVLNNPRSTKLLKKRALFAKNAAKWHHQKKYEPGGKIYNSKEKEDYHSDRDRKLNFLIENKNILNKVLSKYPHKRGIINILLNEGYATNMLNLGYTINPDSVIVNNNPTINPGITKYEKLGNTGLDYISNDEANLIGLKPNKLITKRAFDNSRSLQTIDYITLDLAAAIINKKLNDSKKLLYQKYSPEKTSKFLREHPRSEDRLLYAAYKMPGKFSSRIKASKDMQLLYDLYVKGGLNSAFIAVDKYSDIIDKFLQK